MHPIQCHKYRTVLLLEYQSSHNEGEDQQYKAYRIRLLSRYWKVVASDSSAGDFPIESYMVSATVPCTRNLVHV